MIAILVLSILANGLLGWLLMRASRRLLEFDELFAFFTDDIDVNVRFFDRLMSTPLLMNSPEIVEAHKNMGIINKRLKEYVLRMGETTRRAANGHGAPEPAEVDAATEWTKKYTD